MKKVYNFVLIVLTIALLSLMIFTNINNITNWVDLSSHANLIGYITSYGPVILLCLFAFGKVFGKMLLSKIIFVVILLLLIIFTISTFAPDWISSIFGAN